ncbi:MAG TPA: arginase [Candidatus Tumulicola sp.]|nr:arginase [Candidatus Tumulicola sp.]
MIHVTSIDLIGVPIDYGAGRHGVRLGPDAVREANLQKNLEALKLHVRDQGNVAVPQSEGDEPSGRGHANHLASVRAACSATADAVERSLRDGAFPVVLGGDHSMAIGVLAGIARVKGPSGVIWIDAHADVNTPATSPTGNIHGMSMAVALGYAADLFPPSVFPTPSVDAGRCAFVGLRDLDAGERAFLREHGVLCFTMTDIDRLGMAKVMDQAIERAARGPSGAHVSVDIDSLDPALAPGTGTPVQGGLTYREAHLAMELIAESGVANSLELAEVNPILDEHNQTARVAMELICSALGKSIL